MSADFVADLRAELVGAAHRLHRRRIRRRRIATRAAVAAAVVAVVAAGTVVALSAVDPEPAAAGVEVELADGRIVVTLTDIEVRPQVVEDVLAEHGIDAEVVPVPAGPSNVGRFAGTVTDLPTSAFLVDHERNTFGGFSIPEDFRGALELYLGRPAEPGERYVVGSDAYAPGEPLSCSGLYGEPVTAVAAFAADHPELSIAVQAYDGGEPVPVELDDLAGGPYADHLVVDAVSSAPGEVVVLATADGASPFLVPPSPTRGACEE